MQGVPVQIRQLRSLAQVFLSTVWLTSAVLAFGSDQQKAEKRLHQISAMTADSTARAIINRTMANMVHARRIELQRQRQAMNLNYGALFVAHQLTDAGAKMLDIALELDSGKTIVQIANERNANWNLIGEAAKKLNDKIEDNIYRHFQHPEADKPASDEKYDVAADVVRADQGVTKEELASARDAYLFWRGRAGVQNSGSLDTRTQLAVGKSADIVKTGQRPHR
jgi:hypothetical protein